MTAPAEGLALDDGWFRSPDGKVAVWLGPGEAFREVLRVTTWSTKDGPCLRLEIEYADDSAAELLAAREPWSASIDLPASALGLLSWLAWRVGGRGAEVRP